MFRPAKIYHTTVILNEGKVDELIKKLYESGLCELKESSVDLSSKYSYDIEAARRLWTISETMTGITKGNE